MAEGLGDLFKELEQSIIDDMKRVYSEKTVDHFLNPRNLGRISAADGMGRTTDPYGNTMEIYLEAEDGKVTNASFWTDGCGCAIASGSVVTELAKGRNILDAQKITREDVLDALGGLPGDDVRCALLAADALKEAIKDCLVLKKEPRKGTHEGDGDLK